MAPTNTSTTPSKRASRASAPARKARAKKAAAKKAAGTKATAKRAASAAPKRAVRAAKEAAEPVTRAAGAARRAVRRPASKAGRQQPDAIRLLTDDHREVEALFARFEKTGERAHKRRQDLVQRISEALSVHASIEEEILYPIARDAVADSDVLEALEEHHLVKLTLAELEVMDPSHERYAAKVTVLIENVRHHVDEEEGELFPAICEALGAARLRAIGSDLAAAKRTAPTRPHPEAPDTPPGNVVAQVLTAPLDAAANLNKAAARRVRDIVS